MAKQNGPVFDLTLAAAADLSTKQFFSMKLTAKDTMNIVAAATDTFIGILQDKPKSGQAGAVRLFGSAMAVVDGTTPIAVGDKLGPDANGRLIKKSSNDNQVVAIANDASSAQGDIIEVFVFGPGVFRTLT